jgi:hypothetical protein
MMDAEMEARFGDMLQQWREIDVPRIMGSVVERRVAPKYASVPGRQEAAGRLRALGLTWPQVAKALGYASGDVAMGAARAAGERAAEDGNARTWNQGAGAANAWRDGVPRPFCESIGPPEDDE